MKDYLKQITKIPLLRAEQEVELAKDIEAGLLAEEALERLVGDELGRQADEYRQLVTEGRAAKNQMVTANLRLVVSIARRYAGLGLPLMDAIQEGNLGLIRAVEKFDHTKGYKFSTYATWWVKQAITRGLADKSRTIRLPVHVVEPLQVVQRAERQLSGQLGRRPTTSELAELTNEDPETVEELRQIARDPFSLNEEMGGTDSPELGDIIHDLDGVDPYESALRPYLAQKIDTWLTCLDERERVIVTMRMGLANGEPCTLDEIGLVFGLTRERIRQIQSKAFTKLAESPLAQSMEDFH